MKIAQILVVAITIVVSSSVFAQNTGSANANITNDVVSGNQQLVGGTQVLSLQSSQPFMPPGQISVVPGPAPSLFTAMPNQHGATAEMAGFGLEAYYAERCNPEETDEYESRVLEMKGKSGLTQITVTLHPKALSQKSSAPVKVRTDLMQGKKYYRCLGIATVVATKNSVETGKPVGHPVLDSDLRHAARDNLREVGGTIVALSRKSFYGGAYGVTSDSFGLSLGTNLVGAVAKLVTLGLAPGVSGGSGMTTPASRTGITTLLVVESQEGEPDAIEIDLDSVRDPLGVLQFAAGGNGKKVEASRK
ncbi:MAG: hypothetical protein WCV89_00370 [Candidatus Paceibacterota bacterium]